MCYGMDIFSKTGKLWRRESEEHIEYAHEPQMLEKLLADNGGKIEYMYAFITVSGKHACVVLRIEDNDRATELLSSHGIKLVSEEDIKNL